MFPDSRDDVDLYILMETLLLKKKCLFVIVLFFGLSGLLLSLLLPQKWTSQAIVIPPEMPELIQIKKELTELRALDINYDVDANTLYQQFIKRFDSSTLQEEYLSQSPYIMKQLANSSFDAEARRRLIVKTTELLELMSSGSLSQKEPRPYTSWTLKFTAATADDAQTVLSGYIDYVSTIVRKEVINDLLSSLALKIQTEKDSLALERKALENERNINILRLNYSLEVANAAGIKQPVYSSGLAVKDDPDYSVALGSDGLAQKLKIEQSITDVAHLNASIQNREMRLNRMEKINIQDVAFQPYKYQMAPNWPVKKDGPSKPLILTLSTLFGLMVACGYILMHQAILKRKDILSHNSTTNALYS
ncbi:LPS O-antigen length regulator Wzz(fepE) [Leminorella grimontii]|nr:LPS O-antigen length regulator Wzz(fepE) [Leminorella grimontii]